MIPLRSLTVQIYRGSLLPIHAFIHFPQVPSPKKSPLPADQHGQFLPFFKSEQNPSGY